MEKQKGSVFKKIQATKQMKEIMEQHFREGTRFSFEENDALAAFGGKGGELAHSGESISNRISPPLVEPGEV